MNTITYQKLSRKNFFINSLDEFERYQEINRCWRKIDNKWTLIDNKFTEKWDKEKLRRVANDILSAIDKKYIVYGAFNKNKIIGFILISNEFFGFSNKYIELNLLHISLQYRGRSIGKQLFKIACQDAKKLGANKLYISAHSSEETQAFYRTIGCVEASEINETIAKNEPFDCQLEYLL